MAPYPLVSVLLPLFLLPALEAQTWVRVRDGIVQPRGASAVPAPPLNSATAQPCGTLVSAYDGQPIANAPGASLQSLAFMNPACVNRLGHLAFVGNASGPRNQGVFVADGSTVRAIAMGCGQGGGSGQHGTCGDPSPIGGTFAGFFGGTAFAPPINEEGDVLFLADISNGSASRGLFLYIAGNQSIVKVAAVGDPSPRGGTITALGAGALDRDRRVLFLARSSGGTQYAADILEWRGGVVSSFLGTGDPAPGGATVAILGSESLGLVDGTTVFSGPVPAMNACGQVAFCILTMSGPVSRGIAVRDGGTTTWYLTDVMATPNGGTFFDFFAAALNDNGDIAVMADYILNGQPTAGWFVGRPGNWRHALSFLNPVDGGLCYGLAYCRSPMTPLSDAGDLVVWCDIDPTTNGNMNRIVVCAADGSKTVIARQNGPTGTGGNYGWIDAWPSMTSNGRVVVGSGTPGAPWSSAYHTTVLCGPAVSSSPCTSVGDTVLVDNFGPPGASFLLFGSLSTQHVSLPPYGDLLVGGAAPVISLLGLTAYPGLAGPHTVAFPIPLVPAFAGLSIHYQGLALGNIPIQFTNRTTTRLQ